jgi:hypothetical protein
VTRWTRTLPDDYDELLASLSAKTRKGLRSAVSRLERELGSRFSVRAFHAAFELDDFFLDAEEVSRQTYQRDLGVGFRDDDAARRLASFAAESGWFRGWILYLDDQPVAFDMGVVYGRTFHWINGAFDPAFAKHRPGTCLTALVLRDLCADPLVSAHPWRAHTAARWTWLHARRGTLHRWVRRRIQAGRQQPTGTRTPTGERAFAMAAAEYRPRRYAGHATVLAGADYLTPERFWRKRTDGVSWRRVPGYTDALFRPPFVDTLAEELSEALGPQQAGRAPAPRSG